MGHLAIGQACAALGRLAVLGWKGWAFDGHEDGTYEAAPRRVFLPAHVHNKDLPNLRADWLRQHVRPLLQSVASSDIEILDNRPSPNNERTAELIVFVEWSE